jgi:hypothetical protein
MIIETADFQGYVQRYGVFNLPQLQNAIFSEWHKLPVLIGRSVSSDSSPVTYPLFRWGICYTAFYDMRISMSIYL